MKFHLSIWVWLRSYTMRMNTMYCLDLRVANHNLYYHAPEVSHMLKYSKASDMYSLGICLWVLLFRVYPNTANISQTRITFPINEECSEECCDLFHRLFEHDVSKRIDIDGVLDHKFIRNNDCSLTIRPISSEIGTPSSASWDCTSSGNGNGNVPPSLSPVNVPTNNPSLK